MPIYITTPRPPLNLYETKRVSATNTALTVYEVPTYRIPANGPNPQRDVGAVALLTSALVANTTAGAATVSLWVVDANDDQFYLTSGTTVAANGNLSIALDKVFLQSGDRLRVQMGTGHTADVHISFVLNLREEFTVVT
jgi:hypothetical protein